MTNRAPTPRSRRRVLLDAALGLSEPRHWRRRDWVRTVVFLCGTMHSGTTLLLRLLIAHGDVYATLRETEAFMRHSPWRDLRQLRLACTAQGKHVLVEKSPEHLVHLDRIRAAVPGARFIVMVRDGRDVVASLRARHGWQFQRAFDAWFELARVAAAALPSADVALVRYEDLVTAPEATLRRVCRFLGIEFEPRMLAIDGDAPVAGDAWLARQNPLRAWQIRQPLYDGRGRWRAEMASEWVGAFSEPPVAEVMATLGYGGVQALRQGGSR